MLDGMLLKGNESSKTTYGSSKLNKVHSFLLSRLNAKNNNNNNEIKNHESSSSHDDSDNEIDTDIPCKTSIIQDLKGDKLRLKNGMDLQCVRIETDESQEVHVDGGSKLSVLSPNSGSDSEADEVKMINGHLDRESDSPTMIRKVNLHRRMHRTADVVRPLHFTPLLRLKAAAAGLTAASSTSLSSSSPTRNLLPFTSRAHKSVMSSTSVASNKSGSTSRPSSQNSDLYRVSG